MDGHAVPPGKSILDVLWEDLLRVIDELMDPSTQDLPEDDVDLNRLKGRAEGVAWSIAVLTQMPRRPDINLVKAEAMERWEAEQDG